MHEPSVKEEREERTRDDVRDDAVDTAILRIANHLQSTGDACKEIAKRLIECNVAMCTRSSGTEAACVELENKFEALPYRLIVVNSMPDGFAPLDIEPIVDSVRREVGRRVQGLVSLLG